MSEIILLAIGIIAYASVRVIEIDKEREYKKCEETDWNAYYANN